MTTKTAPKMLKKVLPCVVALGCTALAVLGPFGGSRKANADYFGLGYVHIDDYTLRTYAFSNATFSLSYSYLNDATDGMILIANTPNGFSSSGTDTIEHDLSVTGGYSYIEPFYCDMAMYPDDGMDGEDLVVTASFNKNVNAVYNESLYRNLCRGSSQYPIVMKLDFSGRYSSLGNAYIGYAIKGYRLEDGNIVPYVYSNNQSVAPIVDNPENFNISLRFDDVLPTFSQISNNGNLVYIESVTVSIDVDASYLYGDTTLNIVDNNISSGVSLADYRLAVSNFFEEFKVLDKRPVDDVGLDTLWGGVFAFLETELFPNFKLAYMLYIAIAFAVVMFFIKYALGG